MPSRFRIRPGKLMVIPPGDKPVMEPVNIVYDTANNAFGIQATGEGQLKGYVFFVSQDALKLCRDHGQETDALKEV